MLVRQREQQRVDAEGITAAGELLEVFAAVALALERSADASASSKYAPPGSVIMMNGQCESVCWSVSGMATWLKRPSMARLTVVRVSSEKRKERFSSARGQSTYQPAPSPSGALRKMMRQNVHAPSYGGFCPAAGP